jgi:hypothetical protein
VRALADTGSACNILSAKIFKKIRRKNVLMKDTKRHENFFSADSTPMPVLGDVEVEIKIGGVIVPTIVSVVEALCFDLILGMDFFREAHAVVDMRTNTLTLFDGLTAVPMSDTGKHPVVATTMPVVIPPMSEAVLPVMTKTRLPKRDYVIEGDLRTPCRALLIGGKQTLPCRVMNPKLNRSSSSEARR